MFNKQTLSIFFVSLNFCSATTVEQIKKFRQEQDDFGSRGNWVKKLGWLDQAKELQEKAINLYEEILSSKKEVSATLERAEADIKMFYSSFALSSNDMFSVFPFVDEKITKVLDHVIEQSRLNNFSQQAEEVRFRIYDLQEKAANYQDSLDQLILDLESLIDLDEVLKERLNVINQQVDQAKEILQFVDDSMEKMFAVVDHDKARQIYYSVESRVERMEKLENFISSDSLNPLKTDQKSLSNLTSSLKPKITSMLSDVSSLKIMLEKNIASIELEDYKSKEVENPKTLKKNNSQSIFNFFVKSATYVAYPFVYLFNLVKSMF